MSIPIKRLIQANVCVFLMVLAFHISPAYGEMTIGRWCDKMVPTMPKFNQIMSIIITDDGEAVLKINFPGGSTGTYKLREKGGGVYEQVDSSSGDKYRIVPNNGNLQLLDNDGFIRMANRLENSPQSGECFR